MHPCFEVGAVRLNDGVLRDVDLNNYTVAPANRDDRSAAERAHGDDDAGERFLFGLGLALEDERGARGFGGAGGIGSRFRGGGLEERCGMLCCAEDGECADEREKRSLGHGSTACACGMKTR